MDGNAVLDRYRDFAGLPIAAWRRVLDGDDAALAAIAERAHNPHESWLLEDLVASLPAQGALRDVDRRVLRGLGAIQAAVARRTPTLGSVGRWLAARMRALPDAAAVLDEVVAAMALSPPEALQLVGMCLDAARRDDSMRRVLALDDAALVAACPTLLNPLHVGVALARHAPQRLERFLRGTLAGVGDDARPGLLMLGAAALPRGALAGADFGAPADFRLPFVEHLAPDAVEPFAVRFAAHGQALVRTKRLEAASWTALRGLVLDDVEAPVGIAQDAVEGFLALLPLPRAFDTAPARLLAVVVRSLGNHLVPVAQWADRMLRSEAPGDDTFATVDAALAAAGVDETRRRAFVAQRLSGAIGLLGPSSFGRWLRARDDAELRALLDLQVAGNNWTNNLFAFVAQEMPERLGLAYDALRALQGTAIGRAQSALETMALCRAPGVEELALEIARRPIPDADDVAGQQVRHQLRMIRYAAWKFLVARDRDRYLGDALGTARTIAKQGHWASSEAVQWLVRVLGSDGRVELTALAAGATPELGATIHAHLLSAFGDRSPEAVAFYLAHPQGYVRLTGLRRLMDIGLSLDDARLAAALASVLDDPTPHIVTQALDTAAAWSWAWAEPKAWELLAHASSKVRLAAARHLAAHRSDDTWTRARALLAHKQAPARLGAIALLGLLDPAGAAELFEARLDAESNADVRDQLMLGVRESWIRSGRVATWADVEKRVAKSKAGKPLAPWLDVAALPPLFLADGREVPKDAVAWMLARQARVKGVRPDLEAELLYAQLDHAKGGDFALHLLEGFLGAGAQKEEGFVLPIVGLLGDARVVAPLTQAIHAWVRDKRGVYAEYGVQTLALMRDDRALRAVDELALKYGEKPKNVGDAAKEAFDDAAERLGVTVDELRDRVVPWLGFPEDGTPWIADVGAGKRVVVGIDDAFEVTLKDAATGKPVKSIPKTAPDELKELKRVLKESSALQAARLHNMMVVGARWPLARFRALFLAHPLLAPFARRLVWTAERAGAVTFRAGEAGSLVDAAGRPVDLPDDARVGIAHPLVLDEATRAAWAAVLPEQPFPQLGRPATKPGDDERATTTWHGVDGSEMPTRAMKGQTARLGWRRGDTSGGYIGTYWKAFPFAGIVAHLAVDDMPVALDMSASCTVRELSFVRAGAGRVELGDVHPIVFSEAVADSYVLAGKPPPA